MDYARLSRKHGFKISPMTPCSVEECSLAVGALVGHGSIRSAARMNGGVVIFVDTEGKANKVVETGIVVNETFISVSPLTTPATRVMISNIPPFIRDDFLVRELSKYGKIVSSIRKLSSGCRSPLLKHVVSHRRSVLMILNKRDEELNLQEEEEKNKKQETNPKETPAETAAAGNPTEGPPRQGESPSKQDESPSKQAESPPKSPTKIEGPSKTPKKAEGPPKPPKKAEGPPKPPTKVEGPPKPPTKAEGSELPEQDKENSGEKKSNEKKNEKSDLLVDVGKKVVLKEAVETVELSASAASEENIEAQACTNKRKQKEKVSQAKRVAVSEEGEREEEMVEEVKEAEEEESEEELMEEDGEDEDEEEGDSAEDSQPLTVSQIKSPFFKVQQIKAFLKETKNKRGVKIEEFFTDKSLFLQSVKAQMHLFTEQESYRLKVLKGKLQREILNEEEKVMHGS
ncbi:ribosome-binding protein 1-like [Gymnodraco acuticeps]|uniref:Ribosome-binding protein 1-like n=1 Tax=Gymnodraco acuticeps TaxID=8218 RepID=A0A6P8U963_GYMAC|nr:ribosome-binding protein 1-like [Gymnodraco acuticeps]